MIDMKAMTGRFLKYGPGRLLPDKTYVILDYKRVFGKAPNLKNPKKYSEKIQWLKLYDRQPIYKILTDKLLVRDYVDEKLGKGHTFPLLGVYDRYADIDFDKLPDKFVLKPNHSSGDIFFCEDKEGIDHKALRKNLRRWMRYDYYYEHREWQYKGIKRKILCEKYMEDEKYGLPLNYKFMCFGGEPHILFVSSAMENRKNYSFFNMDLNPVQLWEDYRTFEKLEKPEGFDKMVRIVRELAKPFNHIRMDMYLIEGKVYLGEFTLHCASGLEKWEPEEYSLFLGKLIKLPCEGEQGWI